MWPMKSKRIGLYRLLRVCYTMIEFSFLMVMFFMCETGITSLNENDVSVKVNYQKV